MKVTTTMSERNERVTADFYATKGQPGGDFEGRPVLLLHDIGARSGVERLHPLMFHQEGDGPWYIFASMGGAPKDPVWFGNVVAHPEFDISVGDGTAIERVPIRARVLEGQERDDIYAIQAKNWPQFARYAAITTRENIPVIELSRR